MSDHLAIKIVCCIDQNTLYPGSAGNIHSILLEPKKNFHSLDWNSESHGSYYELTRLNTQYIFDSITALHKMEPTSLTLFTKQLTLPISHLNIFLY